MNSGHPDSSFSQTKPFGDVGIPSSPKSTHHAFSPGLWRFPVDSRKRDFVHFIHFFQLSLSLLLNSPLPGLGKHFCKPTEKFGLEGQGMGWDLGFSVVIATQGSWAWRGGAGWGQLQQQPEQAEPHTRGRLAHVLRVLRCAINKRNPQNHRPTVLEMLSPV